MSNARTRSPFGRFQMRPTHLVTEAPTTEPAQPTVTDMAKMLREGLPIEVVAQLADRSVSTIRARLSAAGYSGNGQPRRRKS